ncbi:MAG: YwmB family TATA-box binding protein [Candidatus Caccovivens sp.]
MKKLLVFILILGCLSSTLFVQSWNNPIYSMSGVEHACIISEKQYSEMESVECGDVYFNFCTYSQAKEKLQSDENIDGLQLYFNNLTFDDIVKKLHIQIVKTESVENITVYCGYTPYWKNCIYLEDKKANIQIAIKEGSVVIGFPAILTGY